MSLDVYLRKPDYRTCVVADDEPVLMSRLKAALGTTNVYFDHYGVEDEELYSRNITHNLNRMAAEAGLYEALWRPDEHGYETAGQLIAPIEAGLERLRSDPDHFRQFNPKNGWGDYEGLVEFASEYLRACRGNPEAIVGVSR